MIFFILAGGALGAVALRHLWVTFTEKEAVIQAEAEAKAKEMVKARERELRARWRAQQEATGVWGSKEEFEERRNHFGDLMRQALADAPDPMHKIIEAEPQEDS